MTQRTQGLRVTVGQHSDKGRKAINQDFHGAMVPAEPLCSTKGIALAIADGISSSQVSQIASQAAITGFLEDYYCTSEAWSVKTAAERVLAATNSWLHAQTMHSQHRFDKDRGYVCTFSALILKSSAAHLFHAGDTRIYRICGRALEQLTSDHRIAVSSGHSYLSRALGVHPQLEIDYRRLDVEAGDVFMLATDGVYECLDPAFVTDAIREAGDKLDGAARRLVEEALARGSSDNLTVQLLRIDSLPAPDAAEMLQQAAQLPIPPLLQARTEFDGFRIVRELHRSSRSHVYLAVDLDSGTQVALKTPATELRDDADRLERFLLEEWIARRIHSPHVMKPCPPTRRRHYLYVVMEYIEGQTLTQWMRDNPRPPLATMRAIVDQLARGLRAFHRLEMVHQDLRPDNILIDATGTVKIIDFGSTRVAGLEEVACHDEREMAGTVQFAAPETFIGDTACPRSDLFSLGVIAYHLLSGKLPYGTQVAKARSRAAQRALRYRPLYEQDRRIPRWVDEAIAKAVHPERTRRHADPFEFVHDLHHPNPAFLVRTHTPLIERNPVIFWKALSLLLLMTVVGLLAVLNQVQHRAPGRTSSTPPPGLLPPQAGPSSARGETSLSPGSAGSLPGSPDGRDRTARQ